MNTSVFLAQAFGLYFLVMGVAFVVNRKQMLQIVSEIQPVSYVSLLAGIVTLILGILLVLSHNVWVADWRVGITILAWLTFIKGTLLLTFPGYLYKCSSKVLSEKTYIIYAILLWLLAAFFICKGFDCAKWY